jgi:sigma-E factor negative regulatory protein RseC
MTGKVRSVSGKMVVIDPERPAGCFGCMYQECKSLAPVTAENRDGLDLFPGLLVETFSSPQALFRQGAAALIPPLLGFIAGFFLAGIIFPQSADGLRAACGVFLLFAAALGFYFFQRRFPARHTGVVCRLKDTGA